MSISTIRELFRYNDWARDRLMLLAVPLRNAELDRPFEMGPGSLRMTLEHLYQTEWVWQQRWRGHSPRWVEYPRDFPSMSILWELWRALAVERNAELEQWIDDDLLRRVEYTGPDGRTCAYRLGHILLHVCTHGTHHRAQVLNMLRHLGLRPPDIEFLSAQTSDTP